VQQQTGEEVVMEATRAKNSGAAATPRRAGRTISDQAAQVWAALITIALFSGIAVALNTLFERSAGA
jgi:hypothetical protein